MADNSSASPGKEEGSSRRLSLHRKTPSTGESAKSSTSNASLSPKPSIRKALLQSPAKKAVGILNSLSPSRRGSETLPEVSETATTQPDKMTGGEDTNPPSAGEAKAGTITPEATKSLQSLSMEDTRASGHDSTQKDATTPNRTDLPSVISGGKLAINRPTPRSPPTLPPRSIYEQMKPTPPKHIEDKDEGMVVDPSSSEHAVEPELVAIEDAEPPPPPIYEVDDVGNTTNSASLDSKNPWNTSAVVAPVDYSMWDDTNSVSFNVFNDENKVDNGQSPLRVVLCGSLLVHSRIILALGLSEGIHTFHLDTRSIDLETHSQLGPGITYLRMVTTGVHSGHQAVYVKPAGEQTGQIPSEMVESALSSIPRFPENRTDSRFPAQWIFCIDCAGWFRIIGGKSTADNFLEGFKLRSGVDVKNSSVGDAQVKIQAIHQAINCGSHDHRRSHHFHEVRNSIPQPPSADLDAQAAMIPSEVIDETATLSSYHCCYCGLFLAYDISTPVRAIFSNDLLNRLFKRDPILGDQEIPVTRFYRTLVLLHS